MVRDPNKIRPYHIRWRKGCPYLSKEDGRWACAFCIIPCGNCIVGLPFPDQSVWRQSNRLGIGLSEWRTFFVCVTFVRNNVLSNSIVMKYDATCRRKENQQRSPLSNSSLTVPPQLMTRSLTLPPSRNISTSASRLREKLETYPSATLLFPVIAPRSQWPVLKTLASRSVNWNIYPSATSRSNNFVITCVWLQPQRIRMNWNTTRLPLVTRMREKNRQLLNELLGANL